MDDRAGQRRNQSLQRAGTTDSVSYETKKQLSDAALRCTAQASPPRGDRGRAGGHRAAVFYHAQTAFGRRLRRLLFRDAGFIPLATGSLRAIGGLPYQRHRSSPLFRVRLVPQGAGKKDEENKVQIKDMSTKIESIL